MNILSLENVSRNYGIKPLFEGVTLGPEDGQRIGIIGANGSGKTTLLRVVAGQEPPDTGRVALAEARVLSFLPQKLAVSLSSNSSTSPVPCAFTSVIYAEGKQVPADSLLSLKLL